MHPAHQLPLMRRTFEEEKKKRCLSLLVIGYLSLIQILFRRNK